VAIEKADLILPLVTFRQSRGPSRSTGTEGRGLGALHPGQQFTGTFPTRPMPPLVPGAVNIRCLQDGHGLIQAVDPATGERKWAFRMDDVSDSGVSSTASDPVFAGRQAIRCRVRRQQHVRIRTSRIDRATAAWWLNVGRRCRTLLPPLSAAT